MTKTSVRLAARAKCVGLSQPSKDPGECALLQEGVLRSPSLVISPRPPEGIATTGASFMSFGGWGWQVDVLDLGDGFPFPSGAQRATALVMLSAVPRGCPIVLDGLAFGALPEAGALRPRTPLIALSTTACSRIRSRHRASERFSRE